MKLTPLLSVLISAALTAGSQAAITLFATTSGTGSGSDYINYTGNFLGIKSGTSQWNTAPANGVGFYNLANVYWDADNDGTFGETGIGENSGNGATTLDFEAAPITATTSYYFGIAGFAGANTTGSIRFAIRKQDTTTVSILVAEGTPVNFSDSNGDPWQASFEFNNQHYGDVVNNISHSPGGASNDHQGVLTLTLVPEPSSAALLGLGGLALILRRRKG
ncbi:MAG: PEP-CTERM sorting domain-containing protein [Akkermansiaceae bacterium]|nr:PEP-CTERM sorting domain-containing protein [Akkermansiaceae bacterium]